MFFIKCLLLYGLPWHYVEISMETNVYIVQFNGLSMKEFYCLHPSIIKRLSRVGSWRTQLFTLLLNPRSRIHLSFNLSSTHSKSWKSSKKIKNCKTMTILWHNMLTPHLLMKIMCVIRSKATGELFKDSDAISKSYNKVVESFWFKYNEPRIISQEYSLYIHITLNSHKYNTQSLVVKKQ